MTPFMQGKSDDEEDLLSNIFYKNDQNFPSYYDISIVC